MGEILYLECASGISGDMAVAALLDAGADEKALMSALDSLPVEGFRIRISRVKKNGLDACDFDVVLDEAHENHDHDMEYLHGSVHERTHGHICEDEHAHLHAHSERAHHHALLHDHGHTHPCEGSHSHEHRGPKEIAAIIDASSITSGAKLLAHRIFDILARAEAQAHGVSLDRVHFHEVGAVDSIVDVVAFAVCLDNLGIDDVVVAELSEGKGTVRCQHGVLPVPVPAVVNIVREHAIPLRILDVEGELVTPTGAAIAAAVRTRQKLPERFVVERVGIGAGKRAYPTAGIVRAMLLSPCD